MQMMDEFPRKCHTRGPYSYVMVYCTGKAQGDVYAAIWNKTTNKMRRMEKIDFDLPVHGPHAVYM